MQAMPRPGEPPAGACSWSQLRLRLGWGPRCGPGAAEIFRGARRTETERSSDILGPKNQGEGPKIGCPDVIFGAHTQKFSGATEWGARCDPCVAENFRGARRTETERSSGILGHKNQGAGPKIGCPDAIFGCIRRKSPSATEWGARCCPGVAENFRGARRTETERSSDILGHKKLSRSSLPRGTGGVTVDVSLCKVLLPLERGGEEWFSGLDFWRSSLDTHRLADANAATRHRHLARH
jgi:hypothetical protein